MTAQQKVPGISGSTLKLIAIITMFIDHTGATVIRAIQQQNSVMTSPQRRALWSQIYVLSRDIGRIAFPIFCFLLVEGFLHTRNVKKYAGRMFLFALISEIPFDLALKGSWYYPAKQNVYFTLLIGLLVIAGISWVWGYPGGSRRAKGQDAGSSGGDALEKRPAPLRWLWPLILAAGMYLANWIDTDYNYKGVFLIGILYLLRQNKLFQCIGGAAGVAWEMPAPIAFLPVYLYNGTRGLRMKYFFYWFYPVHLLLLHVAAEYLVPMVM